MSTTTADPVNWDEHLRKLSQYNCQCGSGGPMSCDDDCPGDLRDPATVEAIKDLIRTVKRLAETVP